MAPTQTPDAQQTNAALRRGQILVLTLLVLGYAGYYFCRANFSVCKPQIIDELAAKGLSHDAAKIAIGGVASTATLAYAIGKFFAGGLADSWGGKRNFVLGMIGAIAATILFTLGGTVPIFTLAWVLNRAVQSLGWPGLVQVGSRWFVRSTYGAAMGILSLSYLFGDAAARAFHGGLIAAGVSWRGVFYAAAGILAVLLVLNAVLLKESPSIPMIERGEKADASDRVSLGERLVPLLTNPAFWCICVLSLTFTLARETFNEWTPTYFVEWTKLSKGAAASQSALFPLLGGVSVVVAGLLSDKLGHIGRALIMLASLPIAAALLAMLAMMPSGNALAVLLIGVIGFVLIGPYSYLAGSISLDFGGKRAGATASGIIDGVGYLAGVLAGERMAKISVAYGWKGAFLVLSAVMLLTAGAAFAYLVLQKRSQRNAPERRATA